MIIASKLRKIGKIMYILSSHISCCDGLIKWRLIIQSNGFPKSAKSGCKNRTKNMGKNEGGLCVPEVVILGSGLLIKSALRCISILPLTSAKIFVKHAKITKNTVIC